MPKKRIWKDSWYPVYGLGPPDGPCAWGGDPVAQFSPEEIAAYELALAEFERWQDLLEARYRSQEALPAQPVSEVAR